VNETRNGDVYAGSLILPEPPERGARGRVFATAAQDVYDVGPGQVTATTGFYRSVGEDPLLAELLLSHSGRRVRGCRGIPAPPPLTDEYFAGGVLWDRRTTGL
jgi:hypothetical protein